MLSPGTQLGQFEIVGHLGSGGMGEVYRARDTKLGREVAIKVLPEEVAADGDYLARFEREARLLASLSHPNIGALYDFQEADGVRFLVLEIIEGETLGERIARGPMPIQEAIPIFVQIAQGLEAAHAAGIVHRDLKPANIKITPDDTVKILDFGIAKSTEGHRAPGAPTPTPTGQSDPNAATLPGTPTPPTNLTAEDMLIGTPSYMSPEQARGKPVDKRSDIWAFGCCLFEALTDTQPYSADTVADTIAAILEHEPKLDRLPANVPSEIVRLISRCMEKDPKRRLNSASDIAFALEDALEGTKTRPKVVTPEPILHQRNKTIPVLAIAVGALSIMVALMAGVFMSRGGSSTDRSASLNSRPTITSLAVLPLDNLMNDPEQDYFVDGMTEAIRAELSKISSLTKVISNTSTRRYKETNLSMPEIAAELGVQGIIEGSVLREGDTVRINVKLFDGPRENQLWAQEYTRPVKSVLKLHAEVALDIAGEIRAEIEPDEKRRIVDKDDVDPDALDAYLKGRQLIESRTEEDINHAIEEFQRAIDINESYAAAHSGFADAYGLLGFYEFALPGEAFSKAEESARRAISLDPTLASAYASLGFVLLSSKGDWKGARKAFEKSLSLDPNSAQGHMWYGNYLAAVGRNGEARRAHERTVELDPNSLIAQKSLAQLFLWDGEIDRSILEFEDLLDRAPDFLPALEGYFQSLFASERYEEALLVTEQLAALRNNDGYSTDFLAAVLVALDRLDEAKSLVESHPDYDAEDWVSYSAALGDVERFLAAISKDVQGGEFRAWLAFNPFHSVLRDDDRFWEFLEEHNYPHVPPGHPVYEQQEAYRIKKAARELLVEQGLDGTPQIKSLAVLPLRNLSPRGDEDYFAESMTEAITGELAKIKALKIRGRTSAMQYKDTNLEIPEIAEALNVDALIEGSVTRDGDEVRINITLQHGTTDTQLWTGSYTETITSVLKLQSDVALAIAEAVNTEITGEERERIQISRQVAPEAHQAYVLGLKFSQNRNLDSTRTAVRYFDDAIKIEPEFAEAWAHLGDMHWRRYSSGVTEALPLARSAYSEALSIDETVAQAHVGLGEISFKIDFDHKEAKRRYQLALSLSPNDPGVNSSYSNYLGNVGRWTQSLRYAETVTELEPEDTGAQTSYAIAFRLAGNADSARKILETISEDQPENTRVLQQLGRTYSVLDMPDSAIETMARDVRLSDTIESRLYQAQVLARAGKQHRAMEIIDELVSSQNVGNPSVVGLTYLNFGQFDEAFKWFETAIERHDYQLDGFKTDPWVGHIREPHFSAYVSDDRFWELCERMNFPPFPPDHPGYADEMRWMAKKAAREMLREAGGPQLLERIAVLPFENYSGDPEQQYFVNGMTDALTAELQKISNLVVISSSATRRYRDTTLPLKDIAAELGVDGLVTGSVFRSGNDIRITAELTDPDTLGSIWSQTYEDTMENVIVVQGKATLAIADAIRVVVKEDEQKRIARELRVDPRAYELYLHGKERFLVSTAVSIGEAIALFEEAHKFEPNWPDPLVAAAQLYHYGSLLGLVPSETANEKMTNLASRALQLDDKLADAISIMATAQWRFEYDFVGAEKELRRAAELAPNSPMVHVLYGKFLAQLGRRSEAIEQLNTALDLSRGDFLLMTLIADDFVDVQPETAVSILKEVASNQPDNGFAHQSLGLAYLALQQPGNAVQVMEAYVKRVDNSPLEYALASELYLVGRSQEAESIFGRLEREGFFDRNIRARLGFFVHTANLDAHIDLLTDLVEKRDVGIIWDLRAKPYNMEGVLPRYKELRQDPRYWELIEKIGLPPLPPDHPGYAEEQAWLIKKAGQKWAAEQGLAGPRKIESLAVLPFDNISGDASQEYFVDGMTGALTSELSKISSIKVIGRASAMYYKGTDKSPREIAKELDVDALITGSALQVDNEVRITAELVHAPTQTTLWSNTYDDSMENVLKLHSKVALDIAGEIQAKLTEEEQASYAAAKGVNPSAYDLYLQARAAWRPRSVEGYNDAIEALNVAIEVDPDFADAHALLGLVHATRQIQLDSSGVAPAREAALRALELDAEAIDAHFALGWVAVLDGWNWEECRRRFQIALDLEPENPYAYFAYAFYLRSVGRVGEAIEYDRHALEIDPMYPLYHQDLGGALQEAGRYEESLKAFQAALDVEPEFYTARCRIPMIHVNLGDTDAALAALPKPGEAPELYRLGVHAEVYAALGRTEEATTALEEMATLTGPTDLRFVINALAILGREDDALDVIEKGIDTNRFRAATTGDATRLLWDNPRYWEIAEQGNLPVFPPEHPAYEAQQRYLINKRAEELIAERGLVPQNQN